MKPTAQLAGLALFLIMNFSAPLNAHAKTPLKPLRVLLTSFDPFGGSPTNNSQPIVRRLSRMASTLGENVQVVACNLPVVYDRAAWAAKDCVQNFHPDVVISFGEGACDLRIETAATNQDDAWLPDNAGELRSGSPIVSGGPARSTFEFPVQAMFCALEPDYSQVAVSTDPGAFVCNNTAYHLSQDLAAKGIPFTFIHVPNSQCEPQDRNVQKNTQIIAQMLRGAIANLRQPIRPDAPWPHPGTPVKMPATKSEAEALVNLLQARRAPVCEQNFARAIVRASIVD